MILPWSEVPVIAMRKGQQGTRKSGSCKSKDISKEEKGFYIKLFEFLGIKGWMLPKTSTQPQISSLPSIDVSEAICIFQLPIHSQ